MASEQLKHMNELYASKRFAHFPLEIDMTKSPTILTRRSVFRAGAGLAVAATATPLLNPALAQSEDARQAGAEPQNGNGFYRFKIGDFQATVISDGYGQIPIWPIFAMNASEAELAPVLKANFMQPVIQVTNNMLVVDTGRERILVDTGFGEKLGPSFGSFPGLRGEPAPGRNHAREHRSGRDVARSPGPYRRLGDEIGRAGVSEGSVRLCRYGVELLDRQPLRKRGQQFADARPVQEGHDWGSSRELATGRRPIPVRAARRRNHKWRALCCGGGTLAGSCLNPVHLGQGAVHAYGRHRP